MSIVFKEMSTFEFLVDAIRRSTRDHNGERPISLSLGPAGFALLRMCPELRGIFWSPASGSKPMLYGVPILELRHRAASLIRHADGQEEEL